MAVDPASLVAGVATASILLWMFARIRPVLKQLSGEVLEWWGRSRQRRMSALEAAYRRGVLRRAQGQHLAAALFALDEVLEEPLLLAPPARVEPDGPAASEDVVTLTVPYMPAWPELGAAYGAPTMTLAEALSGDINIAIIGQPGSGKTVALAHLASLAANRSRELGSIRESVPFLLHAAELKIPVNNGADVLASIQEMAASGSAALGAGGVEAFVAAAFRSGRALVLLDGFDELTSEGQAHVTGFLEHLLKEFPKTKMVVSGAPEYLDGLISLGFAIMPVAAWDRRRQARFVRRWAGLWARTIAVTSDERMVDATMDPVLFETWLDLDSEFNSPLELTLKAWAACAGDWVGPRHIDALACHVLRMSPPDIPVAALETLALQVMLAAQPIFDPRQARSWIKDFEMPEEVEGAGVGTGKRAAGETQESTTQRFHRLGTAIPGLLGTLAASGLLSLHSTGKMRFMHPVFGGFLAGRALGAFKAEGTLWNQPDWIGKLLTMRYYAAFADAGSLVDAMLKWSRLPMHRPLLTAGRWLRDAQLEAEWRGRLLAALSDVLKMPSVPLALRGQALAALLASNDAGVIVLLRRLITGASFELLHLGAIGIGALRDTRSTGALTGIMHTSDVSARRAACLALVAIGTTPALEAVGQALLAADDDLRRAAAEALANHPEEGHAMLRDGATMNDIPLRRAVAYGLGRVKEAWALEVLEKMQLEDDQWIVRNAAAEMIDARAAAVNPRAPRPLKPPSEAPWLIRFAGTRGVGISPTAPATAVLVAALKTRTGDERLAAVDYLKRTPNEAVLREFYTCMYSDDVELREACFLALWEIGASGLKLPDPLKFGMN